VAGHGLDVSQLAKLHEQSRSILIRDQSVDNNVLQRFSGTAESEV
jgi:hypothetical protein